MLIYSKLHIIKLCKSKYLRRVLLGTIRPISGKIDTTLLFWTKSVKICSLDRMCSSLWTAELCINLMEIMFTFIVGKILIFFLHNSQKCSTFALDLKTIVTITIKLNPTTMKLINNRIKQQTQEFLLRLFIEYPGESTLPAATHYTNSRCGTYARLHS